jgi:HD superfamily phosphohydrolase
MTGSGYGAYDLGWLLKALTIDEQGDRLAVTYKGVSAVEAYLQSRYHMYRNVYFHKVVRSAEGMVKLALQRAKRLAVQERLEWPPRESAVQKALTGQRMSIRQFTELGRRERAARVQALDQFRRQDPRRPLSRAALSRGVQDDRPVACERRTSPHDRHEGRARRSQKRAGAGIRMFLDQPADTPYAVEASGASEIMIRDDHAGRMIPFASVSPLTVALNQQTSFSRIHVAGRWRDLGCKSGEGRTEGLGRANQCEFELLRARGLEQLIDHLRCSSSSRAAGRPVRAFADFQHRLLVRPFDLDEAAQLR